MGVMSCLEEMEPALPEAEARAVVEALVGVAEVLAGWEVTALVPDLVGNVFALIAVPGCLIKQGHPAIT